MIVQPVVEPMDRFTALIRMSASTGQLNIVEDDGKIEGKKRKLRKRRIFPSPTQLLSRYDSNKSIQFLPQSLKC